MFLQGYGVQQTEFFVILDPFFAFLPPNNPKNQNFERNEKETMEMLPLYTSVPQIRIIRCMVPEIWSPTDRTFLSF